MKTSGFRCETKFGLLVFLGHPIQKCLTGSILERRPDSRSASTFSSSECSLSIELASTPCRIKSSSLIVSVFIVAVLLVDLSLCQVCIPNGVLRAHLGPSDRRHLHDVPQHLVQPWQHVAKLVHTLVRRLPHMEGRVSENRAFLSDTVLVTGVRPWPSK